jgi:predicted esterase
VINLVEDTAQLAPSVTVLEADGPTTAVVLVLHGGKAHSFVPSDVRQLTAVRMRPFASLIHRRGRRRGVAVWSVRYRVRGWNGAERSPVADAEWALGEIRRRHGDVPVVLVGHSMGGRTALAIGGDPAVVGICALAPWTESQDPYAQLAGKTLLIVHGTLDMVTSPKGSYKYAVKAQRAGAKVGYITIRGEMHAMVYRPRLWHHLTADFALGVLSLAPMPKRIQRALDAGVVPQA